MHKKLTLRLIPALLAVAFSGGASASGFQLWEQNASGLGSAYAGSAAVADNASTIFFNPAGMTKLQDREISVGGSLISTSFEFSNGGSVTPGLSGNGGDAGNTAFVPNGYMSWAVSKDVYLGLGLGAPFGLKTEYNSPWIGSAHSNSFDVKTYNLNPSVAWRASEMVSLGFGVSYQWISAEYKKVASIGGGSTTNVTLDADDGSWGWNIGALFTLAPTTKLGVSYRSAIKHDLEGDLSFSGGLAGLVPGRTTNSNATAAVKLPDTFILSIAHSLNDKWEILGDISWTGWSSIPKLDIMRTDTGAVATRLETEFEDTWRFALGANYKLDETMKLRGGIAYDQTLTKDAEHRLVSLPDNNRLWLSGGVQWKPNKTSALDVGAAYIFVNESDINNAGTAGQNQGLVKGTYDASTWLLGAQYSMSF